jgi:cytochrome b subunit of formate dehydrogenase
MKSPLKRYFSILIIGILLICSALAQDKEEEPRKIGSHSCMECHESPSFSIHRTQECLDCHVDKDITPHKDASGFKVACDGCLSCHEKAIGQYRYHGNMNTEKCFEIPTCADCHGAHDMLPSSDNRSKSHPSNLSRVCVRCHEDEDFTKKYQFLIDNPIEIFKNSVHARTEEEGMVEVALCVDCHSSDGSAHRILSPGIPQSAINHFNIPKTCGKCHEEIEKAFWEGIHGQIVFRGETDAPVCTNCHGEHGILSSNNPGAPVSKTRVAEETCSPCHESIAMTEKYGLPAGRLISFIDRYHGLKTKAGDSNVANCTSCHGVHRIMPSSDPTSSIHSDNLQETCGECHPGITKTLASTPIHGLRGEGLHTKAAELVKTMYIIAIIIIVSLMVFHLFSDFVKQIAIRMKKPQVRRMRISEVWQHMLLMISFIILVISGFALSFDDSWITKVFFGWENGFKMRGVVHRSAAMVLVLVTIWHTIYLFTRRGRAFFKDMSPRFLDLRDFVQQILYNLNLSKKAPRLKRFSYIEKVEYWALIWGTAVMIVTGILLWFDNFFIQFLPIGVLDVALVIHYYEAILATLAVATWHLYSTVFKPSVYPMNPSWLTGKMPRDMFEHEHPEAEFEKEV